MPKKSARKSHKVKKQRSKNKSWKKMKLGVKVRRGLKILLVSFFSIGFSMAVLSALTFFNLVRTPFATSYPQEATTILSSARPFSLAYVVVEDINDGASEVTDLMFLTGNAADQTISIYTVPTDLEMDLPERYGISTLKKVYALGELVGESGGASLVTKTLEKLFAKRIDRYVVTDQAGVAKLEGNLSVTRIPALLLSVRENVETNLTSSDMFFLAKFYYETKDTNPKELILKQTDIYDPSRVDTQISEDFLDLEVITERKRILILNGTGIPGLGGFAGRFISNFGGSITDLDNASSTYDESLIITTEPTSKTLSQLVYQLGITKILSPQEWAGNEKDIGADITVVIGIDYSGRL